MTTQQNSFTFAYPLNECAGNLPSPGIGCHPNSAPSTLIERIFISDISADALIDLASYRLRRSNALWFAARTDGYSIGGNRAEHRVEIGKGASVKCAKNYYQQCVELWRRPGVRDAAHGRTGTIAASATFVPAADSPHAPDCICPDCLRAELTRVIAARTDSVTVSFNEHNDEHEQADYAPNPRGAGLLV
jgi:hypothetical protein